MALLPVSESVNPKPETPNSSLVEKQPRQPTTLQGLMKYSLEASKTGDALNELGPMDEEKKKFLEEALRSMTVDVVKILQDQIKVLEDVEDKVEDENKYLNAFDIILDYVDNIDIANDFHKIGGFMILYPCLKSKQAKIRATACELIAVLCQNNPYCQRVVLDNGFVPFLLNMVQKDENVQVIIKSIYALGGIIRENTEGISQFLQHEGLLIFLNSLKNNNDSVITKICFLLSSICTGVPKMREQLIKLGFVHQLLNLIMLERCPSHEHVLYLLVKVMEDCPDAIKECQKFPHNIKDVLNRYLEKVKNQDYVEEEQYCKRILEMLNSEG